MKKYESKISLKASRIVAYSVPTPDVDPETGLRQLVPTADIQIDLEGGANQRVSREWFGKTVPAVGGYLIELADGSNGYMPGAIFEALFEVEKADTVDVWPPHE